MGSRRERVLVVALVVVMAVLAQFAAPDEQPSAFDPRPSTFHNSPNGARALYLTLEALDIPVA
ncbi:MAG TPA: hypothetical protein VF188_04035, partial [Longimicrobiales bacterium]